MESVAPGRDPRADPLRSRAPASGALGQALQRRELLRSAGDSRTDYAPVARLLLRLRTGHRGVVIPPLVGDSCFEFRDAVGRRPRGGDGPGDGPSGGSPPAQQGHDARAASGGRGFLCPGRDRPARLRARRPAVPVRGGSSRLGLPVRSTSPSTAAPSVVSLIPTRAGNGALDALAARGEFSPPGLGVGRSRARLRPVARARAGPRGPLGPRTPAPLRCVLRGASGAAASDRTCARSVRPRVACAACARPA